MLNQLIKYIPNLYTTRNQPIIGVILAAGKGSRLKCKTQNKTSLALEGKPLVQYGVELFDRIVSSTVIVVGAYADSVIKAVHGKNINFAYQRKRLGTGHAVRVAVNSIEETNGLVLVGYGDHLMFYSKEIIQGLIKYHKEQNATVTIISTVYDDPDYLAWGRVVRDDNGDVLYVVEQKDASESERKIKESNAGFYCFDLAFLKKNINKLHKSPVTGEYYITDFVALATSKNLKVAAYIVPFEQVGFGVNTADQLQNTSSLLRKSHS